MADASLTHETGVREAYAAHAGELYGFALRSLDDRELAEEAVQDTFLRAWRAGDRFDPELGSLRTWLFAILRNVVIDLGRARAARPSVGAELPEQGHEPFEGVLLDWQGGGGPGRVGGPDCPGPASANESLIGSRWNAAPSAAGERAFGWGLEPRWPRQPWWRPS